MAANSAGYHQHRLQSLLARRHWFADYVAMRLTLLKMSQRELARRVKLAPARITQILNEESLPRDIDSFADALELTGEARQTFLRQYWYGPDQPAVTEADEATLRVSLKDVVDWVSEEYDTVYQMRMRGEAAFAVRKADHSARRIQNLIRQSRDAALVHPLLRLRGRIMVEQVIAYSEIHSQKENFKNTKTLIAEISKMASLCHDQALYGMAQFLLGNNYYLIGAYALSLPLIQAAAPLIQADDDRLWVQRGLALDWAYLGRPADFVTTVKTIEQLIDTGQFAKLERVCEIYEAVGRGWGELHSDQAFTAFEKGWQIYTKLEQEAAGTATRFAQLVRGTLTAAKNLGLKDRAFEQLADAGLEQAKKYKKYEEQIRYLRGAIYGR